MRYIPLHRFLLLTTIMDDSVNKIYEPLLNIEDVLPVLNKISIFGGLNEKEYFILFRNLMKTDYKKDEIIFHQGDSAQYIYIVKKGSVKLYIERNNTPLELIEFGVGKCFGETSLIGIQPHSANVIALEDTELIVLSGQALYELYKSDIKLFCKITLNIARETSRRLVQTDDILMHYVLGESSSERS